MSNNRVSELSTKRNKLIADAQALVNEGKANSAEYRAMTAELDIIQSDIDALNFIEARLPKASTSVAIPVAAPAVITQRDSAEHRAKVNDAARTFFKHGEIGLSAEKRALLTTSDATGGGLISEQFSHTFIEASKFSGNLFSRVNRLDVPDANPRKLVTADSTNQTFSLLSEGTTAGSSVAQQPTLFSDITGTDTLISSIVYSVEELQDAPDVLSFLNRIAVDATLRAWETAILLGTTNDGTATALPNSGSGLLSNITTAGVTQTSGELAAGPTYAQLNALAGSVDRSYYANGSFTSSVAVETFLRGQVDTTGRPLYPVDPDTGFLRIAGRPLYPSAALTAGPTTASSKIVIFGDYSKSWNVLNAGLRLKVIGNNDESPALSFLTRQLIIWTRLGQSAGLSNAVKSLVSAAS